MTAMAMAATTAATRVGARRVALPVLNQALSNATARRLRAGVLMVGPIGRRLRVWAVVRDAAPWLLVAFGMGVIVGLEAGCG